MKVRNGAAMRIWIIVVLAALTGSYSFSLNWAGWRGPNRDSISLENNLLRSWPSGGPALLWKALGAGKG